MVGFGSAVGQMLSAFGIRWTNTDEPSANIRMRADRALRNPAVWYAVSKISGHIAQLPLNIHQQSGRDINKPTSHYAYSLMRVKPNTYQTPFVFKRTLTMHALLWGNGYAYIRRQGRRVVELVPLRPDSVAVGMVDGEKKFIYVLDKDERVSQWEAMSDPTTQTVQLNNDDLLHVQGLGSDGIEGYSLLRLASEAWESGNAATTRNLKQLRQGYAGGVALEVPPGQLRDETKAKDFLDAWRRDNDGDANAGKTVMLREGVTAKVLAMSNTDAQFVETLKFMRQEEALRFMLESILGDDASVSYNSLEQKNLAYLQNCLNAWLRIWEEECDLKLLSPREQANGYYFKFNDGALLRTDKKTSMETAGLAIQNLIWTRNEVREMFDLNPVDGGDEFANPAITVGAGASNPPTERDPQQPDPGTTDATNRSAGIVLLERLIKIEAQRATTAAASSKSFCKWIDTFYAKWETKLADDIEQIGGDRDLATDHCNESRRRLTQCVKDAPLGELGATVEKCVESWLSRATTIIQEMELVNV